MKKVLLRSIIMLIVLAIIITIIIIIVGNRKDKNITKNEVKNNITIDTEFIEEENPKLSISKELKETKNLSTFVEIQQCVVKYYNAIADRNEQMLLDLLSNENSNYTIEALDKRVQSFRAREIYFKEIGEICEYYVLGDILWEDYNGMNTVYIIVDVDMANNTFSITPTNINISNNNEYFKALGQLGEIKEKNNIIKNTNNEFKRMSMQTQEIIEYYLNDYIIIAIYYPEIGYNLLNDEYKTNKFQNLEEYKQYIQKNKTKMEYSTVQSYGVQEGNDITQYTVIDNYNNTYILQISDTMQYTVMMDIYTTDLDIITEKYDEGTDEEKVSINVQKIIEAINKKDFKYVYSKLDEQFKQSNYPNLLEFENKMNSMIYGTYDIEFENISQTDNKYSCDIKLYGTTASTTNLNMQVSMQLKEDREFTIIFNIEEE